MRAALVVASMALTVSACVAGGDRVTPSPPQRDTVPMVIAHRGASAQRPEHTLMAYRLAIAQGADAIEPDLVMTRDGVLVARHENAISGTTDVATRPEFADRTVRKRIDGEWLEDWFTEDFTLAELRTLRARERLPELRGTDYDGLEPVPTLDEIIALLVQESQARGREIALVPEIKHSRHFAGLGLAMEAPLLRTLRAHAYTRHAPVIIQSFETANLKALRGQLPRGGNIALLQLIGAPDAQPWDLQADGVAMTYGEMLTPDGLRQVATYADAIGPHHAALQLRPRTDAAGWHSPVIEQAHAAGLRVFAYTFRPENRFIDAPWRQDAAPAQRNPQGAVAHMRACLAAGLDGLFSDDVPLGRQAVDGRGAEGFDPDARQP